MAWRRKRQREHRRVRDLYLRGLGVIAVLAFRSLEKQLPGLVGEDGIAPAADRMARWRSLFGEVRWRELPSLFRLDSSDRALVRTARVGQALGALLALGIAPAPCALGIAAIQLSFVHVGDVFLGYQWDALLVENAAHAALIAPWSLTLGRDRRRVSSLDVALMRALLFRLHFESGLVKWKARDRAWRGLEAMSSYYETAPLPNRLGWYAHHLPEPLQKASTAAALGIECVAPFLGFVGRPARALAFGLLTTLQALIFVTGNYGYFNLLTVVMNLFYLDDGQLPRARREAKALREPSIAGRALTASAGATIALAALPPLITILELDLPRPRWLTALQAWLRPFELGGSYGPFSLMTRLRPELSIEGTRDGRSWRPYRWKYKVDEVRKAPRQVAPHQPRLDWQMWFAALEPVPSWLYRLLQKLLQGSPAVLALLGENPFPEGPPRQVRVRLYLYKMASLDEHRRTGAWWTREDRGEVVPPIGREALEA